MSINITAIIITAIICITLIFLSNCGKNNKSNREGEGK